MTHGIADKFRHNSIGFWPKFKWLVAIFILAILCDALSTIYFMRETGPKAELHIGIQFISELFGTVIGPLIGMVLKTTAGIAIAIYLRKYAVYIFVAGIVISFWAAWYNLWGNEFYIPGLLKIFNF